MRHVLLTGYATDMCFCKTTAGYENLSKDFNVFLVGDATLATYPANSTPRYATNAHISFAAINQLITQVSWVKLVGNPETAKADRTTAARRNEIYRPLRDRTMCEHRHNTAPLRPRRVRDQCAEPLRMATPPDVGQAISP